MNPAAAARMEHAVDAIVDELGREAARMFVPPPPIVVETSVVAGPKPVITWALKFLTAAGTATVSGSVSTELFAGPTPDTTPVRRMVRDAIAAGMRRCPASRDLADEFLREHPVERPAP